MDKVFEKGERNSDDEKRNFTILGRIFSGSSIPVGSQRGKILINSTDSKLVMKAIREAATGKISHVKLSDETNKQLSILKQK